MNYDVGFQTFSSDDISSFWHWKTINNQDIQLIYSLSSTQTLLNQSLSKMTALQLTSITRGFSNTFRETTLKKVLEQARYWALFWALQQLTFPWKVLWPLQQGMSRRKRKPKHHNINNGKAESLLYRNTVWFSWYYIRLHSRPGFYHLLNHFVHQVLC